MPFDPDAFLAQPVAQAPAITPQQPGDMAEIQPQADSSGFDPDAFLADANEEKYGTPQQLAKTTLEGATKGLLGHTAAAYLGKQYHVDPEETKAREESHPILHGVSEAGGFGAGLLADFGLPAALGKAGELATHIPALGEGATIGSKLAKGAAQAATEMGLYQADDEVSKAIQDAPNTMGTVASNIGLAALLGGATGGVFTGAGIAAKGALDAPFLKDFTDTLTKRKTGLDPAEAIQHEAEEVYSSYRNMGSEVGGTNGLKSQALQKLMPEMNETIASQVPTTISNLENLASELEKRPAKYGTRIPALIREQIEDFKNVTANASESGQVFDAQNELKKELDSSIPKNLTPNNDNYHAFKKLIEATGEIRKNLENADIWGKGVASIQKDLNAAWTKAIPHAEDFEKKFMSRIGNDLTVDQGKFATYLKQNEKATNQTRRQEMMGNFVDGMKNFHNTVGSILERAGIENPFPTVGMSSLEESLAKQTAGSRFANLWHNRLESHTLGNAVGMAAGEGISPGFGGAYLGKEVLGPVFTSLIKPLLEKWPNVDLTAFTAAKEAFKNIAAGHNLLVKSAKSVFEGGEKQAMSKLVASNDQIEKLDKKAQALNSNPEGIMNSSGKLGQYAPAHATAVGKGVSDAVNYINSQRPNPVKSAPLDTKAEVPPAQKSAFKRTLTIAQQPLSIMEKIKEGTLQIKDVQDLKAMYPEYYDKITAELMSAMTNRMEKGEPIPYKTRTGMSLFIGQALDSTMTPQAIIAAQPKPQAPQPNQGQKQKSGEKSKIGNKTNDMYKTASQEAEGDRSARS